MPAWLTCRTEMNDYMSKYLSTLCFPCWFSDLRTIVQIHSSISPVWDSIEVNTYHLRSMHFVYCMLCLDWSTPLSYYYTYLTTSIQNVFAIKQLEKPYKFWLSSPCVTLYCCPLPQLSTILLHCAWAWAFCISILHYCNNNSLFGVSDEHSVLYCPCIVSYNSSNDDEYVSL